jgi:GGDEF domain-containing protein
VLSFILLACACQLQFALRLNAQPWTSTALRIAAYATGLLCVALALCMPIFTPIWQLLYYVTLAALAATMALSACLMLLGLRNGHRLAGVGLLSFIPLFGVVILGWLEGVGWLASNYWTYSTAIYVAMFDILSLGLALQWFANERHGQRERNKAMAQFDPLTGFVTAQAFQAQLSDAWEASRNMGQHVAVAYVQLITRASNEQHLQLMLTRCVRILRTAASAKDVVARLEGGLLALLLHNAAMGDDLNQKLSRIIALGLMPEADDRRVSVLQFRIAATTRMRFKQSAQELDTQLRTLLAQRAGWGSKPIRYIDQTQKNMSASPPVLDTLALEETWEAAFKQEMSGSSAQK